MYPILPREQSATPRLADAIRPPVYPILPREQSATQEPSHFAMAPELRIARRGAGMREDRTIQRDCMVIYNVGHKGSGEGN